MTKPFVDLMKREAKGFAPIIAKRSAPEVEPVEDGRPYPNEHAARLHDPDQYDHPHGVHQPLLFGGNASPSAHPLEEHKEHSSAI